MRPENDRSPGSTPRRAREPSLDRRFGLGLLALLIAALLTGCGSTGPAPVVSRENLPAPAGHYRVRAGDTASEIAERYRVPLKQLAGWNGLSPPYSIYAGSLLRIKPLAGDHQPEVRVAAATPPKSPPAAKPDRAAGAAARTAVAEPRAKADVGALKPVSATPSKGSSALDWRWPLDGRVVQGFSSGARTRQGIRIAGRAGQRVSAAEGGTVVYSGSGLKGYGNLIIVRHNNEFLSAYGYNQRLLVSEGDQVRRGQAVAEVGQAADGRYLLHFEVRRNGAAVNPLRYLPASR
jgi:lipoprotein NlpD